jgi:lipopolysaccharide biosynthesis protein
LAACQSKLGIQKLEVKMEEDKEAIQRFPLLTSDFEFLRPLFLAYDDKIEKMERLVCIKKKKKLNK